MDIAKIKANALAAMNRFSLIQQKVVENNTAKVLEAMRGCRVSEQHLKSSTGYGYHDIGRDKLEEVWAQVFKGEAALMRQQIISGTHAITLALAGNLLPGEELLMVGKPYDTLYQVIGWPQIKPGSLRESGVLYREIDFDFFHPDLDLLVASISVETKMLYIQRSRGYDWRPSLSVGQIQAMIRKVRTRYPRLIVFVDNCYGEFVEEREPLEAGAKFDCRIIDQKSRSLGLLPAAVMWQGTRS